jgi:DNA replication protein DnaC
VLFCSAVDAINNLAAAQSARRPKQELRKYHKPALVILDELGYLPINKIGTDLPFQIINHSYE